MVLSIRSRAKADNSTTLFPFILSFGQPYIQQLLAARNDVIMSKNTTVHVGQIRISDTGRNYRKITKLSDKMLWYVACDANGIEFANAKTYRIWIKNADLYLGEPLEIKQAE